ncbi:MAG TPA: hypothetical protein DEF51_07575, partial [Myxococcales bacterium]|nr:hypothetical protein [Myxococcales bacterium]
MTIVQPGLLMERDVPITNFSGNVPSVTAKRVYDVRNGAQQNDWRQGVKNLQRVVTDAEQAGETLRGMGTAWSFSPCAVTDGFLVNVLALSRVLDVWNPQDLEDPSELGSVVLVQAV